MMKINEIPIYKLSGFDSSYVIFKLDDKTTSRNHTKNYQELSNSDNYWLTYNGFVKYFPNENYVIISDDHKPITDIKYVYCTNNYITHIYTDIKVICTLNNKISPINYNNLKDNWNIVVDNDYLTINHIACCKNCSNQSSVIVKGTVKCYNNNELYTNNQLICYRASQLTVYDDINIEHDIKDFKDVVKYSLSTITNNTAVFNSSAGIISESKGTYNFDSEYIKTTSGMIEIKNGEIKFTNTTIKTDDIIGCVVADNEVSHIFTKTKRFCYKYFEKNKFIASPEKYWKIIGNTKIANNLVCRKCYSTTSIILNEPKIISSTKDRAIVEHKIQDKIVKSAVYLVHDIMGYKLVINDYIEESNNDMLVNDNTTVQYIKSLVDAGIIEIYNNTYCIKNVSHSTTISQGIGYDQVKEILIQLGKLTK